jgi:heme/copper-type cytochrome/quinol oxidase subunit 4
MNVTRDVMNDLLPLYFSGEASADTRVLVEEYFREHPEFEREARGAARPLETLHFAARPKMPARAGRIKECVEEAAHDTAERAEALKERVQELKTDSDVSYVGLAWKLSQSAEREKRDLELVHREMRRNKVIFGLALFFTLAPLAFIYNKGHLVWMMVRNEPWNAAIYWALGAVLWGVYFSLVRRRTLSLAIAVFFTVLPALEILRYHFSAEPHASAGGRLDLIWEATLFWGAAAMGWFQYLARPRPRTIALVFAIFLTLVPIPFLVYRAFGGPPFANLGELLIAWVLAAVLWTRYFRLTGKGDSGVDSEC